jgi:hypothetical protein
MAKHNSRVMIILVIREPSLTVEDPLGLIGFSGDNHLVQPPTRIITAVVVPNPDFP